MKSFQWTTIPPAQRYALIHGPHTAKMDIPMYIHRAGFDLSHNITLYVRFLELTPLRWISTKASRIKF